MQAAHLVHFDPLAAGLDVEAVLSNNRVTGLETVRSQVLRGSRDGHRVVAAINGGVWSGSTAELHAPHGLHVQGGELMSGDAVPKVAVGIGPDGGVRLGSPVVVASVRLPTGTVVAIDRINKHRRSGDTALFTARWGTSTLAPKGGVEVILDAPGLVLGGATTATVTVRQVRTATVGNAPVSAGRLVLSADGVDEAALAALVPGQRLVLQAAISDGWANVRHAVAGREWVLRDGAPFISPRPLAADQRHPRTAVGLTGDGKMVLAVVDGRQAGYSSGVTLTELGQMLLAQGVVHAINLDGGGSSTFLVRRPGDVEVSVANRPSDGRERAVTTALAVVSNVPTGPIADLFVQPDGASLVQGQTTTFVARGVDGSLNGVPPSNVTWSVTGAGTIDASGLYRATAPGAATVIATANGISAQAAVEVEPDTSPPVLSGPTVRPADGGRVGETAIPFTISWSATDIGHGVGEYRVRQSLDGGPAVDVALPTPTAKSVTLPLEPEKTYRFSVQAVDRGGNESAWKTGAAIRPRTIPDSVSTIAWTGRWRTATAASLLNGASRYSTVARSNARLWFNGNQVAWVAAVGRNRGQARVYVDGVLAKTVDLRAATSAGRRIVFRHAFATTGPHRIDVRVVGTRGRPRVDIDGFITVDPGGDPVIVGAGDIADCSVKTDSATAALLDRIPGTVFTAGDNAYQLGTAEEFAGCYRPTWGRHLARTRPVAGNHDYGTAGAAGYFGYFAARAGEAGKGWYAWDVGAWRVYALNSNCEAIGGCGAGSAQLTWLTADLAANPRQCVAAIWHHPVFTSGVHGNDPRMAEAWQALQAAGAELVVTGHDHDYERFAPQLADGTAHAAGLREFVVGTGGAPLRPFGTVQPNSEVREAGTHGVLRLTLRPTGYDWTFLPVAGKTFRDAGAESCH